MRVGTAQNMASSALRGHSCTQSGTSAFFCLFLRDWSLERAPARGTWGRMRLEMQTGSDCYTAIKNQTTGLQGKDQGTNAQGPRCPLYPGALPQALSRTGPAELHSADGMSSPSVTALKKVTFPKSSAKPTKKELVILGGVTVLLSPFTCTVNNRDKLTLGFCYTTPAGLSTSLGNMVVFFLTGTAVTTEVISLPSTFSKKLTM